jgi:hypothetical protein
MISWKKIATTIWDHVGIRISKSQAIKITKQLTEKK